MTRWWNTLLGVAVVEESIGRNRVFGVNVANAGTLPAAGDFVVSDTGPGESDGSLGIGVNAIGRAQVTPERASIQRNRALTECGSTAAGNDAAGRDIETPCRCLRYQHGLEVGHSINQGHIHAHLGPPTCRSRTIAARLGAT